jgi:hypothetical protein
MPLTREEATALAKLHAKRSNEEFDYLKDAQSSDWKPHDWVVAAIVEASNNHQPQRHLTKAQAGAFIELAPKMLMAGFVAHMKLPDHISLRRRAVHLRADDGSNFAGWVYVTEFPRSSEGVPKALESYPSLDAFCAAYGF